jgi:hypothetical protein
MEAINKTGSSIGTKLLIQVSSHDKELYWQPKNIKPLSYSNKAKSLKKYIPSISISSALYQVCQLTPII